MKLCDLIDDVHIEGYVKIQCWEDDTPTVYYEGDGIGIGDQYRNREILYIFPYDTGMCPGITIELDREPSFK